MKKSLKFICLFVLSGIGVGCTSDFSEEVVQLEQRVEFQNLGQRIEDVYAILKEYNLDNVVNYKTATPNKPLTEQEKNYYRDKCELFCNAWKTFSKSRGFSDQYYATEESGTWIGERIAYPAGVNFLCAVWWTEYDFFSSIRTESSSLTYCFIPESQEGNYGSGTVTYRESGYLMNDSGFVHSVFINCTFKTPSYNGGTAQCDIIAE